MSDRLAHLNQSLSDPRTSRLQKARQSTKLDGEELRNFLFGDGNYNNYIKPTLDFIDQNRGIFTQQNIEGHSHLQQRKQAAKMVLALRKFWKIDLLNRPLQFAFISYAIGAYNGGVTTRSTLHYLLYAKSLLLYQSNPLHLELYQSAMRGECIGCFSLTQFHHGSYSKGIQTLATYDPKTDEFVITTQGTKGMKHWIGGLAEISNTTILWAQLIINGKSQGPHPFYFPIRCKNTHKVLPGITIGDCGPKKGLNQIDNGYMTIDDVRVPRQYLLGKYGSVDSKGVYISIIKNQGQRFGLHMSALSAGRAFIAFTINVFNAVSIALRYSHSRKQFETNDKKDQITIIDYPLTQIRIIPEISKLVVQLAAGYDLAKIYCDPELFKDQQKITEMHAISAAVKARFTWVALKASEECRTILGGHGYSSLSRIPSIVDDIEVNVTWEGDNNMLLQQTSKYLMKAIPKKPKGKVLDLSFVNEKVEMNYEELKDKVREINSVQLMIQDLLRVRYQAAVAKMAELKSKYSNKQEIDYQFHPQAGNALALAFADYYTFVIAKTKLQEDRSKETKDYFSDCLRLWAFSLLEKYRYGTHQFRAVLQKHILALSGELVNRSVVATDYLAAPSHLIGSPFANPDGDGFKEYISILYTNEGAFSRAKHHEDIRKVVNKKF